MEKRHRVELLESINRFITNSIIVYQKETNEKVLEKFYIKSYYDNSIHTK